MIILPNKAEPSSAPFMILLLASISTVFGCGVIPGASTRTFTASGTSNLPVIAVYTNNNALSALIPGIATGAGAVQAFAQRFAMQTVIDVLEIEGRRALLPDFVISNILRQLQVNTTYEPLLCKDLKRPEIPLVHCTEEELFLRPIVSCRGLDGKHLCYRWRHGDGNLSCNGSSD
ncbi:hypothetical protein KIN20_034965 [Parelaphostrongylus tenuis]|uniref:Lipoprotein n=1 Tax=Parelaphostrongylus tenuis TaxID=148309 RepID=A0AAD5RAI1_PARTN|nr:hypothetical protein KIN20_034965 [Parelaphostrongylus tenuis]